MSLAHPVFALGLSPPKNEFTFEPNFNGEFEVNIRGESQPFNVKLIPSDALKEYIVLSQDSLTVPINGATFSYILNLPASLPPGRHKGSIVVEKQAGSGDASMFGAIEAVGHVVAVNVPAPGKHAEVSLAIKSVNLGEPVTMTLNIKNLGTEQISISGIIIEIFNAEDSKVSVLQLAGTSIAAKEEKILETSWPAANAKAGKYTAKVKVTYGDNIAEAEASFRIGDLAVTILDLTPKEFPSNKIIPFSIEVESLWSENIGSVFAELKILDGENELKSVKTAPISVDPFKTASLEGYLDTSELDLGDYVAKVLLTYGDKTSEKEFEISVVKADNSYLLIVGIVLLIVIILLIIFALTRKSKRRANIIN